MLVPFVFQLTMDTKSIPEKPECALNKEMPMVSIVIPVYNGIKHGLGRCLESVVGQTYLKKEIIIVDDYSLDDSVSFCHEKLLETNYKLKVNKENYGLSKTWNQGLIDCKGEFIVLLQQDCYFLDNAVLWNSIERMLNGKLKFAMGYPQINLSDLNCFQKAFRLRLNEPNEEPLENKESSLTENKCDIIQKDLISTVGNFDETFKMAGQDFIFSMSLYKSGNPIHILKELKYGVFYNGEDTLYKIMVKEYKYAESAFKISRFWKKNGFKLKNNIKSNNVGYIKKRERLISTFFPSLMIFFLLAYIFLPNLGVGYLGIITLVFWVIRNMYRIGLANKNEPKLRLNIFTFGIAFTLLDCVYFFGVFKGVVKTLIGLKSQ